MYPNSSTTTTNPTTLHTALAIGFTLFPTFSLGQRMGQRIALALGFAPETAYIVTLLLLSVYVGAMVLLLCKTLPRILALCEKRLSSRQTQMLLWLGLLALIGFFAVFYPASTAGAFGGGSDRDEGLNIAVDALLRGDYPYYLKTFVPGRPHELGLDGNPISPMPGELLLSIPFVLLGNGAYQSFFWLAVTALLLNPILGCVQRLVPFFGLLCFLLPNVPHELGSGGDLFVNGLWFFCSVLLIVQVRSLRALIATALLFGLALSSRPNFFLLAPLAAGLCYQCQGYRLTLLFTAVAAMIFLLVTLPFYLYDPAGFSPLHAYSKLGQFDSYFPKGGLWVPLMAGVVALVLMVKLQGRSLSDWSLAICAALAIPVLYGTLMQSIRAGRLDFIDFSWYGIGWLAFAVLALFGAVEPSKRVYIQRILDHNEYDKGKSAIITLRNQG